jgi:hypothetical protein
MNHFLQIVVLDAYLILFVRHLRGPESVKYRMNPVLTKQDPEGKQPIQIFAMSGPKNNK